MLEYLNIFKYFEKYESNYCYNYLHPKKKSPLNQEIRL